MKKKAFFSRRWQRHRSLSKMKPEISKHTHLKYVDTSRYGWLQYAWLIFGIDISGIPRKGGYRNIIRNLIKYIFSLTSFSIFIIEIAIYCYFHAFAALQYQALIASLMLITPMLLWASLFTKRKTIQDFFMKMTSVDTATRKSEKRLKKFVNILFLVEISCITLQAYLLCASYPLPGSSFGTYFATAWHYYSLTSVMIVTYCSICCFFILLLRNTKKKAAYLIAKPSTEALQTFYILYYEITDRIEDFHNAFSSSSFFCIMQLCFVLSLDIMFVVAGLYTESIQVFQMVSSLLKTSASLLGISVAAAQVNSEVNDIRNTLVNAETEFTQNLLTDKRFNDLVDLILRKDIPVLSGWNILTFEKGFILKTFAAVSAQVVLVYQVIKL